MGMWGGTVLLGALLFVERWWRGQAVLTSQGSWLLAASTVWAASWLVATVGLRTAAPANPFGKFMLVMATGAGLSAILMLAGFWERRFQRGWNSVLILAALRFACFFLGVASPHSITHSFSVIFYLLLEVRLFVLVIQELVKGVRRDWMHWLGVGVELLSIPALVLTSMLFSRYLIAATVYLRAVVSLLFGWP